MARIIDADQMDSDELRTFRKDSRAAAAPVAAPAPAPVAAPAFVFNRENPSGTDEFGFPLPEVPKITAATPGAVYVPTYTYDRGGAREESGGYYRLPSPQESGKIALAALPQDIKNKISAGQLTPDYEQVRVRDGRGGEGYYEEGKLTGFSSVSPDNIQTLYDLEGNPTGTRYFDRSGGIIGQITSPLVYSALLAMGGAGLSGLFGAGAAPLTFTPEMIAAGATPGGIGAAGAASGALTGEALAAASGIGSLGAGALTGAAGTAALPASEVASLGSGATLGSLEGGLTAAELAGLPSLGTTLGATEGALTAAEMASLPSTAAGATHLTPAAMESLIGTGGYGVNASALEAAAAAGIPAAQVGAGASSAFPGVTPTMPKLTPAAIESLANTPGYGKNAAAAAAAAAAGMDPNNVGLNADLPFPGVNPSTGITDLLKKAKDKLLGTSDPSLGSGSGSGSGLGGILGLMALMSMMNKGNAAPVSTATIPELKATRSQLPYDVNKTGVNPNTPYRPGQGGVNYFSPTTYKAAGGGIKSIEQSDLGGYSDGGRLLKGPGDGVSDSIPAIIGRKQPARLANGEFVIPARIVSELGNGSTDAGAKRLYEMMARVQKARRNTKNVAANTKAAKYLPA
jgi:hypothetical protein